MPYTPPSQSPASSPIQSRTSSISLQERPSTKSITTSNPPRSSSFSNSQKVRRSASYTNSSSASRAPEPSRHSTPNRSGSLHQSPPPVNHGSFIPTGAIISPPDSLQNSSDDDDLPSPVEKRRGRHLEGELDELKEALKHIPQRRVPSPDNMAKHTSPTDLQPLSPRKYSHSRSTSDSSYLRDFNNNKSSYSGSDAEDDAYRIAPPMIRKKSGELVKSSLKTPNRSRPSSVPSTPTFPKAVHFDSHLEHVRHFHKVEKPSAVSAGSSPVDSYDGETEFPFDYEDAYRSPPFEWEIELPNFPKDLNARKPLPVRVERVYLSSDKLNLLGTVAVANIAYQKLVVVRFTLDFWQTVSEVTADYNNDFRRKNKEENVDRFTFKIKLHDQANLESKTLFFCVRYNVAGQEIWDNNNSMNFQVDFKKKMLPQNGKGAGIKSALPRSRPSVSTSPRPMSMPNLDLLDSFDDVTIEQIVPLERTTIQVQLPVSKPAPGTSGNVFSNRYDFSASLSAAITAANTIMGPAKSGLTNMLDAKEVSMEDSPYFNFGAHEPRTMKLVDGVSETAVPALNVTAEGCSTTPLDSPSKTGAGPAEVIKVATSAEKPPIESLSYRELLETYCFVRIP